jgi:hypothetical protein
MVGAAAELYHYPAPLSKKAKRELRELESSEGIEVAIKPEGEESCVDIVCSWFTFVRYVRLCRVGVIFVLVVVVVIKVDVGVKAITTPDNIAQAGVAFAIVDVVAVGIVKLVLKLKHMERL